VRVDRISVLPPDVREVGEVGKVTEAASRAGSRLSEPDIRETFEENTENRDSTDQKLRKQCYRRREQEIKYD
jgi:hypothetical protein